MTKLLDEEIEEDELFWNQDSLKEVVHCAFFKAFSFYFEVCSFFFFFCG